MARGRRILLIAAGLSIGVHIVAALLIVVLPRMLPQEDRRPEQGTIELVMEEHKGAEPGATGEPQPDQPPIPVSPLPTTAKPDPAKPKTEQPSKPPVVPPIEQTQEEAVPPPVDQAQSTASRPDTPAQAEPPQPPPQPATQIAPTFNFREAESEYDALVLGGGVIPATLDTKFRNRPPIYPVEAAVRGEHGRVVLIAHVGPNGLVRAVDVVEATGFPELDRAAVAAFGKWRFHPAMRDGQGVAFDFQYAFVFGSD